MSRNPNSIAKQIARELRSGNKLKPEAPKESPKEEGPAVRQAIIGIVKEIQAMSNHHDHEAGEWADQILKAVGAWEKPVSNPSAEALVDALIIATHDSAIEQARSTSGRPSDETANKLRAARAALLAAIPPGPQRVQCLYCTHISDLGKGIVEAPPP